MRVLITRPEREATALAQALGRARPRAGDRAAVPAARSCVRRDEFAAALAACQAVLLTSANGARALAEASEQRSKPILAVGDTTASTAEGLGFAAVVSAAGDGAALADLVRQRLDPKNGPLLHVSGADVAVDLGEALAPRRLRGPAASSLYEAREAEAPAGVGARRAEARALDVATFFSPRAAQAVRQTGRRGGAGRPLPQRHRHRHQPRRRRAARRVALPGDRRGSAADPPGGAG